MRKIRLSYYEFANIQGYRKVHWFKILFCYFRMSKVNSTYHICAKVHPVAYVFLFIPLMFLTFLDCIWNCGLKEFQLPPMQVTNSYIYPKHIKYDYCEVLWDAKNKG